MALEINLPSGTIPFQTSTSHEWQTGGPAVVNPTIVDCSNSFHIHADWQTQGGTFALMNPMFKWKAEAIFELMGNGEFAGGPFVKSIPFNPVASLKNYSLTIDVPPMSVPDGIYRIVLKISLDTSPAGLTTTPVCGFEDLGLVEFYN